MAERHRAGCCGRAGLRLRGCRVPGLAEDQQDSRVLVPTAAQRFASQFRFSWLGLRRHFCSELRFAEASVVRHSFAGAGFFGVKQGGKKLGRKEAAVGGHSLRTGCARLPTGKGSSACLPPPCILASTSPFPSSLATSLPPRDHPCSERLPETRCHTSQADEAAGCRGPRLLCPPLGSGFQG